METLIASLDLRTICMALSLAEVVIPFPRDLRHPEEISHQDITGQIFERPETEVTGTGIDQVKDVTTLLSSDGKFGSGMYSAGPSRIEVDKPYGIDEFLYILDGSITLTSSNGRVNEIVAGEAVTIPREWTGVMETEGYQAIWTIYSHNGAEFR